MPKGHLAGLIGVVALVWWTVSAQAEERGEMPTVLACTFDTGTSWSFEGGKFASEPAKALSFEIGNIDLEKQSASLAMDGKSGGVLRVVRALNANSFLEVANEGFLNLTTIYDRDAVSGAYPAVHSRHFGVLGQPVFAQYAGTCKGK